MMEQRPGLHSVEARNETRQIPPPTSRRLVSVCSSEPVRQVFHAAPLGRRGAAYIIDLLLPLPFLTPVFAPWALVVIAYLLLRDSVFGGVSPGKRLMGLHTVTTGRRASRRCNIARSALRNSGIIAACLCTASVVLAPAASAIIAIEVLTALFRPDGRRLGDLLAGTQVVVERKIAEETR